MRDDPMRRRMETALGRLEARAEAPRVLALSAGDRARLGSVIERARAQLLGPSEPVLTVALAGSTGAGKSTLINGLAGHVIAEVSEIRPTTRHLQVYHHRGDDLGTLTEELASEAVFVAHDRPELRLKMLVDSPDLDSFVIRNRATTKALLKRAGLVLYVFSPERYLEERTWTVLRQETSFSACAAVLNKVDRVGSRDELEQITADLRERFASLGLDDIRIFRVCARAHVPGPDGTLPDLAPVVDDMVALRAFIERELQASEIARLLRAQRGQVVTHLCAEVDRLAPELTAAKLDEVVQIAAMRAERAAARLSSTLAEPLAAAEAELAPLVTLRRHERFWGPFRIWLATTDFLGFGLTNLVRRILGRKTDDGSGAIERILGRGGATAIEDLIRAEAFALQDLLFTRGLPIERWREIVAATTGTRVISEVAAEIETHFDVTASHDDEFRRKVVWAASTLGNVVPSAFVVIALFAMLRDVLTSGSAGLTLLWQLMVIVILFFLVLQGVVGAVLPGGARWTGLGAGARAVQKVIARAINGWVAAYRADLLSDVADLREPLDILESALAEDREAAILSLPQAAR